MAGEDRKQDYLAEAARAEASAKAALIPEIRDSWLRIAAIYRQMAGEEHQEKPH